MATIRTIMTGYRVRAVEDISSLFPGPRPAMPRAYSARRQHLGEAERLADELRSHPAFSGVTVTPETTVYEVVHRTGDGSWGVYPTLAEAEALAAAVAPFEAEGERYDALRDRLVHVPARHGEYTYAACVADALGLLKVGAASGSVWALLGAGAERPEGCRRVPTRRELPDRIEEALWTLARAE